MPRTVKEIQDHSYSAGEEDMVDRRLVALGCSVKPGEGRMDKCVTTPRGREFLLDVKGGQTRSGGLYGDRVVYSGIVQAAFDRLRFGLPTVLVTTGRMPLKGGRREKDLQEAISRGWLTAYCDVDGLEEIVTKIDQS